MKSLALLTTMAAAAAVGAVSTTLRGVAPPAQQQEPPHGGVEEVGEQIEHYPPPNWDGMHAPSRRVLMERQLEGVDDAEEEEEEEVHDPYVGMLVVGNLIDDVEEDDFGLYDWEEDDERKDDKSYEPPIDSVTVSPHYLPHSTTPRRMSLLFSVDRLSRPADSRSCISLNPSCLPITMYRYYIQSHPPPPVCSSRGTISKAMSTTVAPAPVPYARTRRDK